MEQAGILLIQITDRIFIGDIAAAKSAVALQAQGITHVVVAAALMKMFHDDKF